MKHELSFLDIARIPYWLLLIADKCMCLYCIVQNKERETTIVINRKKFDSIEVLSGFEEISGSIEAN